MADQGVITMPQLVASGACPSREDVTSTPFDARWKLWAEEDQRTCSEGCRLHWFRTAKVIVAPRCVKRKRARWSVPCRALPSGCYSAHSELVQKGAIVEDIGMLSVPTLAASARCPAFDDVANTKPLLRNKLWHDGTTADGRHLECADGCMVDLEVERCRAMGVPCCVRRLHVVAWSVPCHMLRHGCPAVVCQSPQPTPLRTYTTHAHVTFVYIT